MTSERAQRVARALPRVIGLAALCVVLWLDRAVIPRSASAGDLDGSWMQALCHVFDVGLLAGEDWILPLGPLGGFLTGAYDRDLFWTATLVWECGVKLAMAVLLGVSVLRVRGVIERVGYCALLLLMPIAVDAWAFLALIAVTLWILDRPAQMRPVLWFGLALFAVLALVKLSVLMLSAACVFLIALAVWRTSTPRRALLVLGVWAAAQLAAWLLAGQSLGNILPYLTWSLEVAAGHNAAMTIAADTRELAAAGVAAACALLVAVIHAAARPRTLARAAGSLALVSALFIAFKAGFTRGDGGHTRIFFTFAAAAPFLLGAELPNGKGATSSRTMRALARAGRFGCAAAAVCGVLFSQGRGVEGLRVLARDAAQHVKSNAISLLDLGAQRRANDLEREELRRANDLPRVRDAVGMASIDMVSFRQGLLLLNDLNWKPRFTLQGYSAYTPALLAKNAALYRGEDAPEFVLFDLGAIDGRMPTMEDNQVLEVLLRHYRPLFLERDFLLLRRDPRPGEKPARASLLDRTIRFGEAIELPAFDGGCRLLALDVRPTLLGKAWTTLYAAPPLFVELQTDGGSRFAMRIVPGMMQSGVILDPFLADLRSWIEWGQGETMPSITRIRLLTDEPWMYAPDVRMRLIRADDLVPTYPYELGVPSMPAVTAPPHEENPAIVPAPVSIESDRPVRTIPGRWSIMAVHAPSRVCIEVPAGRHELSGQFGLATAARRPDCATMARMRIVIAEGEISTTLVEESLDPARAGDRDGVSFDVTFETRAPARLWLVTESTGSQPRCAWTYWKAVRLL